MVNESHGKTCSRQLDVLNKSYQICTSFDGLQAAIKSYHSILTDIDLIVPIQMQLWACERDPAQTGVLRKFSVGMCSADILFASLHRNFSSKLLAVPEFYEKYVRFLGLFQRILVTSNFKIYQSSLMRY